MANESTIVAPSTVELRSSLFEEPSQQDDSQNNAQIFNMDVNYANENKWFGMFQIEDVLGKKYKNLNLHITRFSIPQLVQGTMEASFRGYSKEMPTKVLMPSSKEITPILKLKFILKKTKFPILPADCHILLRELSNMMTLQQELPKNLKKAE